MNIQTNHIVDQKLSCFKYLSGDDDNTTPLVLQSALENSFWINNTFSEIANAANPFSAVASTLVGLADGANNVPRAYLTYLFFDEEFNFIEATGYDYDQVTADAGDGTHEQLSLNRTFTEDGYLYVFVSNHSSTNVYFDDLTVRIDMTPVDQVQDYYPYGSRFNSYTRPMSQVNRYFYQGKEEQELVALYDFHARLYDGALGRFAGVDPQGQFGSPYLAFGNNPVMYVDPDGEWAFLIPIVVGAVINTASNWDHISSADNFWQGFGRAAGYASVGALQGGATLVGGPAGFALSGAIGGLGNGLMQGMSGNLLLANVGISAVSGFAGGMAAQGAGRLVGDIASPLLDGLVKGTVGGAAGGFFGGGVASSLMGGDFLEGAWSGLKSGAITGAVVGASVNSYLAAKQGFNPLNGQRTKSWLAKNNFSALESKAPDGIRVRHHTDKQGL